jgi:hypothetical protein
VKRVKQPVVRTVDGLPLAELERAEGVGDVLERVDDAVREVVAVNRRGGEGRVR